MKIFHLVLVALFCLMSIGCGPKENSVVAPSDTELTAEEAQAEEEEEQEREEYESGGDRE